MIDPVVQQARQNHLEALYFEDRRDDPEHPMHSLYTGLAVMERWRENSLATPMPIDSLWCMIKRECLHIAAGNYEAAKREAEAIDIFTAPREGWRSLGGQALAPSQDVM